MDIEQYNLNNYWFTEEIRKEIKRYLEASESETTIYWNILYIAKSTLKGKFIAMRSYI
jgi:hypothetical protein